VGLFFDKPAGQLPIDGRVVYDENFDEEFHGHDRALLQSTAARLAGF
jgi:hypothetical protein